MFKIYLCSPCYFTAKQQGQELDQTHFHLGQRGEYPKLKHVMMKVLLLTPLFTNIL